MSDWLDPVGPHASGVYWRRRAVALVLLVGLLWVATRACGADEGPQLPTGNNIAAGPVPTSSATAPPPTFPESLLPTTASALPTRTAPTGTRTPGAPVATGLPRPTKRVGAAPTACRPDALAVSVWADARRYDTTTKPRFTITVANTGRVGCKADVGPRGLSLVVISGKDRIWSSDDCEPGARGEVRLLRPGQSAAETVVWNRLRSRPGCPKGLATAQPGTYVVGGRAGGVEQERRAVFELR